MMFWILEKDVKFYKSILVKMFSRFVSCTGAYDEKRHKANFTTNSTFW